MRGRWIAAVLACLLLSGCSGLPTARERGDMALLRTMGVDKHPEGVEVTVSTGPRARGLQGEGEPSLVLSAARPSLSAACLAMQGQSDSFVFYGYVDQLLLGQGLAEEGIQAVLDYFSRDVELGLGAQLWLIRDATAKEAVDSGEDEGVEGRLSTLRTDGKMGVASISRTAGEVYTDLLEQGAAFVPALTPAGEDDTSLTECGYAVLKGERLAGFLDAEAARGLELLSGRGTAEILEEELPDNRLSVRLSAAYTTPSLLQSQGAPVMKVTCRGVAELVEYQSRLTAGEREALQTILEARVRQRLKEALEQMQAWETDCTGLGARAAMGSPAQWQDLKENWPHHFGAMELKLEVQVDLRD